jgi:hypothetical protein
MNNSHFHVISLFKKAGISDWITLDRERMNHLFRQNEEQIRRSALEKIAETWPSCC